MKKATFEIRESTWGEEYFVLKAPNGKVILVSETYKSRQSLLKGVDSVRKNVDRKGSFHKFTGKGGLYRFSLRAKNNKIIGKSEGYLSKFSRWNGIQSVRRNARKAKVTKR